MIKIVESQSLRTTWNISSWTYYIIPNLMLITVVMLSVTMASQIIFTLSTQIPRISGPPRRSITDIHSRFRGCGVVLNWCSRRCCRWWWWWRRGGKQWVIAVLTFTCFHAAALAIELAEGGPDTGLSPHKLDLQESYIQVWHWHSLINKRTLAKNKTLPWILYIQAQTEIKL